MIAALTLTALGSPHAGLALTAVTSHGAVLSMTELFTTGVSSFPWSSGKHACYRIPSLLRLHTGELVALASERLVANGCNDESPSNIVMRRSLDGGTTWGNATLVLAAGVRQLERSAWALEDASNGALFVFSNANVNSTTGCSCGVEYVVSTDRGVTFSKPGTPIPTSTGVYGSGLASGITHSGGRLIGCMRKICRNSCPADYHSMAFFSDDHGATWAASPFLGSGVCPHTIAESCIQSECQSTSLRHEHLAAPTHLVISLTPRAPPPCSQTTECQLAELSDGRIYMTIRPYKGWTGQPNVRLASVSSDAGSTWSEPKVRCPLTP